jgi:hypothetical protein
VLDQLGASSGLKRLRIAEFCWDASSADDRPALTNLAHTRWNTNPSEDAVLVIVDFPAAVVASAFAMRFGASISYCRNPHHRTAGSGRRRHLSPSISVLHARSLMA